jgi:ABC-type nitrate/sulfonate/bicarbonate transport system permease component
LVGVVVSELFGATAGVGYLISVAGSRFETDKIFVGVALARSACCATRCASGSNVASRPGAPRGVRASEED